MDFQAMYENVQAQLKLKGNDIVSKKNEISAIEAEIYKLQGASEMLIIISNELEKQKTVEEVPIDEPVVAIQEPIVKKNKKTKTIE
jgi:hypothetical protein